MRQLWYSIDRKPIAGRYVPVRFCRMCKQAMIDQHLMSIASRPKWGRVIGDWHSMRHNSWWCYGDGDMEENLCKQCFSTTHKKQKEAKMWKEYGNNCMLCRRKYRVDYRHHSQSTWHHKSKLHERMSEHVCRNPTCKSHIDKIAKVKPWAYNGTKLSVAHLTAAIPMSWPKPDEYATIMAKNVYAVLSLMYQVQFGGKTKWKTNI